MRASVTLRPVCSDDESFLLNLYRSVHEQTFSSLDMSVEQKTELLRMQFNAQQTQYRSQFPIAKFDVILSNEKPIGSLFTLRGPEEFVLIDISLLPEHRNGGIGGRLVTSLIQQANDARKPLQAHVLKNNPAWHLWQRLGFEEVDEDGMYLKITVPAELDYE
jgi:ribosomal protein S18 acetylase RimI-like enzyme